MLTIQELDEVKHYVLRELPHALEQDPQFVLFIEGIISEKFPRRDEFTRLLDELTAMRQEQRQNFQKVDERFEQVDRRLDQVTQEMRDQGTRLSQEMRNLRDWVGGVDCRALANPHRAQPGRHCSGRIAVGSKPLGH